MNPAQILAHFDRISDAPNTIPRLRRFIFDLAVRGKLLEQDPRDEPASELLKRIQEEKTRLVTTGEIKTLETFEPVKVHEIPFTIPSGWEVIRMGWLARKLGAGSTPLGGKSVYQSEGVPFLRSQNVHDDGLRLDDVVLISRSIHERMSGTHVQHNDMLLNITGASIGRCALIPSNFVEGNVSQHVAIIRLFLSDIRQFIHLSLTSPFFQKVIDDVQVGVSREGLSMQRLRLFPMLLPPLAEQHRIVAKVNELMALCDRLEAAQTERESQRERLTASSLQRLNQPAEESSAFREHARFALDHLPRLTTRPEHIQELRQTILNLAVRGQLVPQDPNDEPASELLKRIQAEKVRLVKEGKIKKERPLPDIGESSVLFDLPDGWSWVRLGDLSQLVTSGSRDWAKFYSGEGAIFVRMGNLSRSSYRLRLDNIQRVKPPTDSEGARTKLEEGDILISITGEVGLLGLVPAGFGDAYINQHTCLVRPMSPLRNRYLPELFRSPFAQNQFNEPQRGIKNSFRLTDVTQLVVPLPPLAEQHRIVAKVDELMALCDRLEAQLTTAQTESRRLLEAVLHEALSLRSEPEQAVAM